MSDELLFFLCVFFILNFFFFFFFFFQAEDGIRDKLVTGVQTCALPILRGLAAARTRYRTGGGDAAALPRRAVHRAAFAGGCWFPIPRRAGAPGSGRDAHDRPGGRARAPARRGPAHAGPRWTRGARDGRGGHRQESADPGVPHGRLDPLGADRVWPLSSDRADLAVPAVGGGVARRRPGAARAHSRRARRRNSQAADGALPRAGAADRGPDRRRRTSGGPLRADARAAQRDGRGRST